MVLHTEITEKDLHRQIKQKIICLGGNRNLKIYGNLQCKSGKRMKKDNRIFFTSENDAIINGFRPCGHCMKAKHKKWKNGLI